MEIMKWQIEDATIAESFGFIFSSPHFLYFLPKSKIVWLCPLS
jgi:hypothetical protein